MMGLGEHMIRCTGDIGKENGKMSLEAVVRAYDLLDLLLAEEGRLILSDEITDAAAGFLAVYDEVSSGLDRRFDEAAVRAELAQCLVPLGEAMTEARFEAASAASLHEFAKDVYEVWQTSGIFARRRALRELRKRAGFRLESHRIGNYVAKTFDLMNEAQARFAKAQQSLFSADVSYKIHPGLYARIADVLRSSYMA